MNSYEAIGCRRSIRKFKKDRVSDQLLAQIAGFGKKASALNDQIGIEIEILDNSQDEVSTRGLFKVEAPYYLVFYSEPQKGCERNAGYILEQIVLYMATKGLGSCYWGGGQAGSPSRDGKKRIITVAFGYPDQKLYRDSTMAKRLPLSELCVFKEEVGENLKTILRSARLAPSALNSQPWRFIVYADRIYIFARKDMIRLKSVGFMRDLSIGIMMAHIMLAAEELWLEMESSLDSQFARKTYKNGDYVATVTFH